MNEESRKGWRLFGYVGKDIITAEKLRKTLWDDQNQESRENMDEKSRIGEVGSGGKTHESSVKQQIFSVRV